MDETDLAFRKLSLHIDGSLDEKELQTMKYLCKDDSINLPLGELENSKRAITVFGMLENKMMLGDNNLALLVELLNILNRPDLVKDVQAVVKNITEKPTVISEYRKMIVVVASRINESEFGVMKDMCKKISGVRKTEINFPIDLMNMLEKHEKLGPTKLELLLIMVNESTAKIVQEYKHKDAVDYYTMNCNTHGLCLIINNIDFKRSTQAYEPRIGSQHDEGRLKNTFEKMKFKVKVVQNKTKAELKMIFEEIQKVDHTDYDSFVCCLMSHGNLGYIICDEGEQFEIKEIADYVHSSNCPSLAYKPKLFFIETCRGNTYETKLMHSTEADFRTGASGDNYNSMSEGGGEVGKQFRKEGSITDNADFLFAYASSPGSKAKLKMNSGSVYIEKLTYVLNKYYTNLDIVSMLTLVNRLVCQEEFREENGIYTGQTPTLQLSLRKRVHFN